MMKVFSVGTHFGWVSFEYYPQVCIQRVVKKGQKTKFIHPENEGYFRRQLHGVKYATFACWTKERKEGNKSLPKELFSSLSSGVVNCRDQVDGGNNWHSLTQRQKKLERLAKKNCRKAFPLCSPHLYTLIICWGRRKGWKWEGEEGWTSQKRRKRIVFLLFHFICVVLFVQQRKRTLKTTTIQQQQLFVFNLNVFIIWCFQEKYYKWRHFHFLSVDNIIDRQFSMTLSKFLSTFRLKMFRDSRRYFKECSWQ